MSKIRQVTLALCALAAIISLRQDTEFADKGWLASGYLLVAALCIWLGQSLRQYTKQILLGFLCSAIILALSTFVVYAPEGAAGIYGLLGQKNLFANWIACGVIVAIWFRQWIIAISLVSFMVLSGSKAALLYIPILLWTLYARLSNR